MACFMRPDSLYTDVAVNTCCQCLNKNFPYHHVYQDKCVARYILLPELILAEHGKCHLCFLKGFLWSSHLAFKNPEHGWMDPDAFSNRSYGNMENSFILSNIISALPWHGAGNSKYFCSEPIVVYSTGRKIKSFIRENFKISWCLKAVWDVGSHFLWSCVFQEWLEQNYVNIIAWEIQHWF